MTAPRVPARRTLARRWPALVLVVGAATLRLFHVATAYDIDLDEVTYTKLAGSVAAGHGVLLYDKPFFLHPPMLFWVLGGLIRILGSPRLLTEEILAFRPLNIALSVLACVALIAMVERATTKKIGLVAGALFAVDAFAIRFDGRLVHSRYETFGVTALEAMACGRAVVAYCLREIVSSGGGILVKRFDTRAYADATLKLLADRVGRRRRGEQGRLIARDYDWDVLCTAQEAEYELAGMGGGNR